MDNYVDRLVNFQVPQNFERFAAVRTDVLS